MRKGEYTVKREKIRRILEKAAENKMSASVRLRKDNSSISIIALECTEKLALAAHDRDFSIDGYIILPLREIKKAYLSRDMYARIIEAEGTAPEGEIPVLDLSSLKSVCRDLCSAGRYVSVDSINRYYVGKIESVGDKGVMFSFFDARGIWYAPEKIPFKEIRAIYFGNRYTDIFARNV